MVFCSLIASSAIRAFISALKVRRCLDFISAPFPRQRFYTLLSGPNFGEHFTPHGLLPHSHTSVGLDRILSLQQFGFTRSFERFPVFPDDADFLSVESRKLYRLSQKRVLVVLIVCGKSVLMNNHHVSLVTAGICEVGQ